MLMSEVNRLVMKTTYGEMLRTRRKSMGLTLRELGKRAGFDAGYLSRVERGVWKPPMSYRIVLRLQQKLGFSPKSDDGQLLVLLAAVENGIFPRWVKEDEELLRDVAAFIWKRRAR